MYSVALGISCIIIIPLAHLYTISNFELAIGTFKELFHGVMIQNMSSHRYPASASIYDALYRDLWYREQYMPQDQKIPKAVFLSQVLGEFIGVSMNTIHLVGTRS